MSFLDYGTDLVGSIRIPASFCGVYGLRPSADVVPLTGLQPPGPPPEPGALTYMSAVGPLARSAADLRVALQVGAGPQPPAALAYEWVLAPPRRARLRDFRVGVVLDHSLARPSDDVAGALSNTVDALARAGVTIVEGWPAEIDGRQQFECFGFHVQLFFAYQQPAGPFDRIGEFVEREHERQAARAAWQRYFEDIDVFLCPTNFTTAFAHDRRPFGERRIPTSYGEQPYDSQAFWVAQPSLPGLPVVVAPIGATREELPVGVQIVGPLHEDDTALAFAELLEEVVGGYVPPPI
jgi:amidase